MTSKSTQFGAGQKLPGTPEPMLQIKGYGGLTLAADAWGDPQGKVVMLLHGGGQTRHAWKGTGEILGASGYYAIALDARGHGDSEWAQVGGYGYEVMIEDLKCVLASINKTTPILVGASMGGVTSLIATGEALIPSSALVLVDVAPNIEPDGVYKINEFMTQSPEGFHSLEEVAKAISNYQPHRKRPQNLDGLAKNVRLGADGMYKWHWDPNYRTVHRHNDQMRARLESAVKNLQLPTLLVRGGLSDVLSEEGAQAFLQICPGASYVNVKGTGHMVAGDRNDIFADAVINFLNTYSPA
jgi:non-heme chloroperoxidase